MTFEVVAIRRGYRFYNNFLTVRCFEDGELVWEREFPTKINLAQYTLPEITQLLNKE